MNNFKESSQIYKKFLEGKIRKEKLIDNLLIHFPEEKNNLNRLSILHLISKSLDKTEKSFKFLESLLTSDEDPRLRAKAVEIVLKNFLLKSEGLLIWVMENEDSPVVLNEILKHKGLLYPKFSNLKKVILSFMNNFGSNLGVSIEEVPFYIELETILLENKNQKLDENTFIFFHEITNHKGEFSWITKKGGFIIKLHYHFFAWKYLRNNINLLNSLKSYRNFTLFVDTFRRLSFSKTQDGAIFPSSIRSLKNLEYLDISFNNLKRVPGFIKNLSNLSYLDLSNNRIREIPKYLNELSYFKNINLENNLISF
jgi:Leucine-rich repeat (LRR) protein